MDEYIKRGEAIKQSCDYCNAMHEEEPCEPSDCLIMQALKSIPAADVRPVVRAECRGIGKTGRIFVCSACDKTFPYKTRYCPNCGAVMEES